MCMYDAAGLGRRGGPSAAAFWQQWPLLSRTVVLGYNAPKDSEEHIFGHSGLSFAALMLWLGAIRCSSRLPIQQRRFFGAEIKS